MNKEFKVIQINGLSGMLILGFVLTGMICGFIFFPIWVLMTGWNAFVGDSFHGPKIDYLQAMLLWFTIVLSMYLFLRNSISIKIQTSDAFEGKNIKGAVNEVDGAKTEEIKEEIHK